MNTILCSAFWKYPELELSLSIGISMYPNDRKNLETLYAGADEALYQAKKQGKNQFVFASDVVAGKLKT